MLVGPIPVAQLMAYFGVSETELLVRKARVEVAVHSWVLGQVAGPNPKPVCFRPSRSQPARPCPTFAVPEWKRSRPRAGRVWEPKEDAALLADFEAGSPPEEIAFRLGRGSFSVEVRLCKLGCKALPTLRDQTS
jgi:hypothetical protein